MSLCPAAAGCDLEVPAVLRVYVRLRRLVRVPHLSTTLIIGDPLLPLRLAGQQVARGGHEQHWLLRIVAGGEQLNGRAIDVEGLHEASLCVPRLPPSFGNLPSCFKAALDAALSFVQTWSYSSPIGKPVCAVLTFKSPVLAPAICCYHRGTTTLLPRPLRRRGRRHCWS